MEAESADTLQDEELEEGLILNEQENAKVAELRRKRRELQFNKEMEEISSKLQLEEEKQKTVKLKAEEQVQEKQVRIYLCLKSQMTF